MRAGSAEPLVRGFTLRGRGPAATLSPICLPPAHSPHPIPTSLPTRTGILSSPVSLILPPVAHLIHPNLQPALSHLHTTSVFPHSISSPSPLPLSSPSYPNSDFLSHLYSQTACPSISNAIFSMDLPPHFQEGTSLSAPPTPLRDLRLQPPSRGWRAPSAGRIRESQSQILSLSWGPRARGSDTFWLTLAFREEGEREKSQPCIPGQASRSPGSGSRGSFPGLVIFLTT
ncbi:hypothetical protein Cadr_000007369 [Camelus dromedarius]|uniref:Uncharacterized protein n=1 Tax=Camelus dromedarius TaxID=9838 RepID=A0A5N4E6H5_CAMDR|nr:hypothetical protein Cadr_000007369 [Camelus dromedarius]